MSEKKKSPLTGLINGRGKVFLLVGAALLGILCLLFGTQSKESDTPARQELMSAAELEEYKTALEGEIEALCESVAGVSSVEVMVTLECGTRVQYATDRNGDPATTGNGSSEQALYTTVRPPVVAGVAVVCRGGDHSGVQATLVELLSTALGISAGRVFVTGK